MDEANVMPEVCKEAKGLALIYEEFTNSIKDLGAKGKSSSKMGASMMNWIGGSKVTNVREQICENFLENVQNKLEKINLMLETESDAVRIQTADIIAEIMMKPVPEKSNATSDLMKRAMIGQIEPFLQDMSEERLKTQIQQMDACYSRWGRLPVERDIYKKMKNLIK